MSPNRPKEGGWSLAGLLKRGASLDGFDAKNKQAFSGFDAKTAERVTDAVDWIGERLDVRFEGLENLPVGRGLLVANHAFGWDVAFAIARIRKLTGRTVWALGEHAWWAFPALRKLASAAGTVDGTPENADRLLEADQLVLVLPGGLREAVKPRELRYRLLWGQRYGFIRAAIRNQAPLVPLASLGADDMFDFVGNAYQRGERWLHRTGIPLPLPSRILPIPHRVAMSFVLGEPIPIDAPRASESDPFALRRLRHEVEGALHELFEIELARRAGIELGDHHL